MENVLNIFDTDDKILITTNYQSFNMVIEKKCLNIFLGFAKILLLLFFNEVVGNVVETP